MADPVTESKNALGSIREIVQDLLVPELKAIKAAVESLRNEMKSGDESLRNEMKSGTESLRSEMKSSAESLRNEMKIGFEALHNEIKLRDEKQSQANLALSDKLSYTIDIRERLAVLEDRVPRN